jgi:hypothetical protein
MPRSRPSPAYPAAASPGKNGERRVQFPRPSPLARDIGVILVVKAVALCVIWLAFFRDPAAPDMTMDPQRVEQKLLAPSTFPELPHAVR